MAHHGPSITTYRKVFVTLMALLALTVTAAFIDFDRFLPGTGWSTAVAILIALVKGVLIVMFFMHVRYAPRLTWAFAGAGFLWLGILLVLTMSDYMTRNAPAGTNYRGEPRYLQSPGVR